MKTDEYKYRIKEDVLIDGSKEYYPQIWIESKINRMTQSILHGSTKDEWLYVFYDDFLRQYELTAYYRKCLCETIMDAKQVIVKYIKQNTDEEESKKNFLEKEMVRNNSIVETNIITL